MKVYATEILIGGSKGWTRTYCSSLEEAVDLLAGSINRDNFEQGILYEAELREILTYTNPRVPHQ